MPDCDPFDYHEYHKLLARYQEARLAFSGLSYQSADEAEQKDALKAEMAALEATYWARLPIYLLARCPICGGEVREAVDTYSLNGLGWRNRLPDGLGWRSGRFYEANCDHAKIVGYGINLNGIQPDDVTQWVGIGSEKPFVMKPVINLERTLVVIHALPVSRANDVTPTHRYTLYFTTYFSDDDVNFQSLIQPFHQDRTLFVPGLGDYELTPWVANTKLYWLDTTNTLLPLRHQPINHFPYGNIQGVEGMWYIQQGQLHMLFGPKGQQPR